MRINVILYDDNMQPACEQRYNLDTYLSKLKNRIISVLYQIEENRSIEEIQKFIKKIYYEMNSINELSDNLMFFSSICDVYAIKLMIEEDEEFNTIRSMVLETANNVVKVGGK